jgi:hypothetical protein
MRCLACSRVYMRLFACTECIYLCVGILVHIHVFIGMHGGHIFVCWHALRITIPRLCIHGFCA